MKFFDKSSNTVEYCDKVKAPKIAIKKWDSREIEI